MDEASRKIVEDWINEAADDFAAVALEATAKHVSEKIFNPDTVAALGRDIKVALCKRFAESIANEQCEPKGGVNVALAYRAAHARVLASARDGFRHVCDSVTSRRNQISD